MKNPKFYFECRNCHETIDGFEQWFADGQKCPKCGEKWVDVRYFENNSRIPDLISEKDNQTTSMFHYFDYLPLVDKRNIITMGEGAIKVDRWQFLEKFAKKQYGINLTVLAYRNDDNYGTGTFKDVAAAMAASVLKEQGIKEYCVASTGNIANSFAYYLAIAGISLAVFIPDDALKANEAGVSCYGQKVFRVKGDYSLAKKIAAEYSSKHHILLSGGNIDPARVEAKKTQVFEWLRQLGYLPDVYLQALAGGTGPIAIDKGLNEIRSLELFDKDPRYVMVQTSGCDPMTAAWQKAQKNNFPEGWLHDFPIYNNPKTKIPTLANGNPQTFPIIGHLVYKTDGDFLTFNEDLAVDVARLVAFEIQVQIGPAAAIAVGGFFEGLKQGVFKEGERIMLNIGEGMRRSPELLEEMIYTTEMVSTIDECQPFNRLDYRERLWEPLKSI